MHAIFFPYGTRGEVEILLRDMEATKFQWPMWKGKKKQSIWISGGIRKLPFGLYEYIFPKEYKDVVLNTLNLSGNRYNVSWLKLTVLRKFANCDKLPEFEKKQQYNWVQDYVNITLIGVREDNEVTDAKGEFKGWTHEAL